MIKDCHVGVKGVVKVSDKCLVLQKGTYKDAYWDIPGGRIDDNETLEQTLNRELLEELPSLKDYKIGGLAGAYRLSKNIADDKGLVLIFYVILAADFDVEISGEHSGYRWVTKDNISELKNSEISIEEGYYQALLNALDSAG